ncbi:MAG: hypothetical protein P1R58_00495 [bacterium]|nr:hypothetical protein [bacterium]
MMRISELKCMVFIALIALIGLIGCNESTITQSVQTDLVDSLEVSFEQVRLALEENHPDQFLSLIDPVEAAQIKAMAVEDGYKSLQRFILRRMSGCPDIDTLQLRQFKQSGHWSRLAYVSFPPASKQRHKSVRYTFLLFRKQGDDWKLNAVNSLEQDRFDSMGQERSFHETELPVKLRFPRL